MFGNRLATLCSPMNSHPMRRVALPQSTITVAKTSSSLRGILLRSIFQCPFELSLINSPDNSPYSMMPADRAPISLSGGPNNKLPVILSGRLIILTSNTIRAAFIGVSPILAPGMGSEAWPLIQLFCRFQSLSTRSFFSASIANKELKGVPSANLISFCCLPWRREPSSTIRSILSVLNFRNFTEIAQDIPNVAIS